MVFNIEISAFVFQIENAVFDSTGTNYQETNTVFFTTIRLRLK